MTINTQASTDTESSPWYLVKTNWLNIRRKRFWAIVIVLLYTVLGFFVAPVIIKSSLLGLLQDDLKRSTQIESIEVNPYELSLRVQGFQVNDTDNVKLLAFDDFFVNFQVSSLINWAWTFAEIRLTEPYFFFERYQAGDSRIDQLLADLESIQPRKTEAEATEKQPAERVEIPRLLIHELTLNQGNVDAKDNVPATAVESQLKAINISIQQLSTLPNSNGRQLVAIQLPNGASLKWSGSLSLEPLAAQGELVLEDLKLDPLVAYLKAMLPLDAISIKLSSTFQYNLTTNNFGELALAIDDLDVVVDELAVSGLSPVTDFVGVSKISLLDGMLRYPQQKLNFGKLSIDKPQLSIWLNENGRVSLLDLVPASTDKEQVTSTEVTKAAEPSDSAPWQLGIDQFTLTGGNLALADRRITPNAALGITDLQVSVSDISNRDNAKMPFDLTGQLAAGGSYQLNGNVVVLPELSLAATAKTKGLALSIGQAYVQQFANLVIEKGALNSDIEIAVADQQLKFGGSIEISDLEITDNIDNHPLLGWRKLELNRFDFNDEGLHLSQINLKELFGRVIVHEDKSTNLSELVIAPTAEVTKTIEKAESKGRESETSSMNIVIDGIRIDNGALNFADLSLPLPFATHIQKMDGSISTIATNSTAPANIKLQGQVNEYGLAGISGSINLFDPIDHLDIGVKFNNLSMAKLSPYTVAFTSHEIAKGKLDLSLGYVIEKGQLQGANAVVMDGLELGKKIDQPDAANLPLGLAIALLKDSDGVIAIDLPVAGDVNNPGFAIGGLVWQALSGIISKAVTSPFRLLGSLIGLESDTLGQFKFLAGRADLTPPELEKIVHLQKALQQRPELVLDISGVSDKKIDIPALRLSRLSTEVNKRLNTTVDQDNSAFMSAAPMLNKKTRVQLELLFAERFQDVSTQSLKAAHTVLPAKDAKGDPIFDELAYTTDLWNRLLAVEVVSEQDLADLAKARAETIRAMFMEGDFDPSRIVMLGHKSLQSKQGEWVTLELGIESR